MLSYKKLLLFLLILLMILPKNKSDAHTETKVKIFSPYMKWIFVNFEREGSEIPLRKGDLITVWNTFADDWLHYIYNNENHLFFDRKEIFYTVNGRTYGIKISHEKDIEKKTLPKNIFYLYLNIPLTLKIAKKINQKFPNLKILKTKYAQKENLVNLSFFEKLIFIDLNDLNKMSVNNSDTSVIHLRSSGPTEEQEKKLKIEEEALFYLTKLPNLKILNLEAAKITRRSLFFLEKIEKLRILNLKRIKFSQKNFFRLKKALPNCTILFSKDL